MARRSTTPWPTEPRTVFFNNVASAPTLARARKEGRIRLIATGVWTADLASSEADIIRDNVLKIISRRIGFGVLVDRTAAAAGRIDADVIAIATDSRKTDLKLPGVTVRVRPLVQHSSDNQFRDDLYLASPARTLVDNLSGAPNADRYLNLRELQDWLARKKMDYGTSERRFGRLHSDALQIARDFGLDLADRIDSLFATINQYQGAPDPIGPFAAASAAGNLYDQTRLNRFTELRSQLTSIDNAQLQEPVDENQLPFFEAYFSNYIEGTEFGVEEARQIVEANQMPAERPEDAHDVLYTYRCVTDRVGRMATSNDPAELRDILLQRHQTFMASRPAMAPGVFKNKPNYVGGIEFVKPGQVEGTLTRALSKIDELPTGIARAIYVMVVVAEVHPFLDGNGRAARLMMNAELSAAGLCRVVIPTVCRNEYIGGLRKFTLHGDGDALIKVLDQCWRWTHSVPWSSKEATESYLQTTNAFMDSNEAAGNHIQLEIL